MTEFVTTAQALQMRSGVNIVATVASKGDPRAVNLKAGGTTNVCDCILKDDFGEIKFTLWGDDIATVNVNDKLEITNGFTNEFKGEVGLGTGKFGKFTKLS
jgi:replication factor A1